MTLAKELAETNAILRQAAQPPKVEEEPEPRPLRHEPERLRGAELLLAIPDIGAILREHFKDVPPKFFREHEDKSRTVTCLCSEQTTIPFGGLHECKCQRLFFCGKTLRCAPAPNEDDIEPCDLCGSEVRRSQGTFVSLSGMDGFLCGECQ